MTTTRPERLSPELVAEVQSWLDQDPDEATRTELSDVLVRAQSGEAEAIVAVESAFAGPLTFGTAGLRAALGPGHDLGGIAGEDVRIVTSVETDDDGSSSAGAGFHALLADSPIPTPVTAFAIKHYGAVAGVMVTASHNPPADNGYKVYLGDGSQIVPPTDAEIAP